MAAHCHSQRHYRPPRADLHERAGPSSVITLLAANLDVQHHHSMHPPAGAARKVLQQAGGARSRAALRQNAEGLLISRVLVRTHLIFTLVSDLCTAAHVVMFAARGKTCGFVTQVTTQRRYREHRVGYVTVASVMKPSIHEITQLGPSTECNLQSVRFPSRGAHSSFSKSRHMVHNGW